MQAIILTAIISYGLGIVSNIIFKWKYDENRLPINELKPCPICKNKDIKIIDQDGSHTALKCNNCNFEVSQSNIKPIQYLINKWNKYSELKNIKKFEKEDNIFYADICDKYLNED